MEPISAQRDLLGESPVWSRREQALYWVDIHGRQLHRWHAQTGLQDDWSFSETVGCVGLNGTGRPLIAVRSHVVELDPATGDTSFLARPEKAAPNVRFNDGKCDPQGRLIVGTMDEETNAAVGKLWCIEKDGTCRAILIGCRIPNGLAWSRAGDRLYHTDSPSGVIMAYDYDQDLAVLGTGMPFAHVGNGIPDGGTVDEEDHYWCAVHGGSRLERFTPAGKLDRVVKLPVQYPTSCCFGGPGMETLFVTSASRRVPQQERHLQPLAGATLALGVGVRGF